MLSQDEESALWKEGIISLDNPVGPLNAVFFKWKKLLFKRGSRTQKSEDFTTEKRDNDYIGVMLHLQQIWLKK